MQTFLPHPTLRESLDSLDNKRLNKQILEAYQILNVLTGQSTGRGWKNHPAVLMWKGSESELVRYAQIAMELASYRGIKVDKNKENIYNLISNPNVKLGNNDPIWLRNSNVLKLMNTTHQANLYRKDPEYYAHYQSSVTNKYNKPCCDRCQYYWPTHKE